MYSKYRRNFGRILQKNNFYESWVVQMLLCKILKELKLLKYEVVNMYIFERIIIFLKF